MLNTRDPSWLPTLEAAAVRHELTLPSSGEGEPNFLQLPARPGVAVFEGEGGRALLIATTGDLRDLARRRLSPPDAALGPRTDHRAITRRIAAIEVGSSLEADVLYLSQARTRMPETHQVVSERWRPWFVQVDAAAEFPQWTKTCLSGSVAPWAAGDLLGPFADKDSAGRFIERVIDAFDLCREHHLLVQAPAARACPYKEMGRCPAPCDGSEPMESFRSRTRRAAEIVGGGLAVMRERLALDMRAAAESTRFEEAAMWKQQLARLDALAAPAFAHIGDARSLRLLVVVPASRASMARVLLLAGGRLGVVGEAGVRADANEVKRLADRAVAHAETAGELDGGPDQLDALAAVTRWLYAPGARRRGVAIRIHVRGSSAELSAELGAAILSLKKAKAAVVPNQSVEA